MEPAAAVQPLISLTFDDGLDEHLDHAIPLLEEQGLRGTFYGHLAAPAFAQRIDEWRAAATRGHELGNHTIFHPADRRKSWVREGNAIDLYSIDRMRLELETANRILTGLDGCTERTFAYPCSNTIVGRHGIAKRLLFKCGFEHTRLPALVDRLGLDIGSTQRSYASLVRELFVAGRGGGLTRESIIPPLAAWDRAGLFSVAVNEWTIDDLVAYTERGCAAGTWVILQFHGVGGGHRMDCQLTVFREFLAWIADHHADKLVTVAHGVNLALEPLNRRFL